jgi:hypothetical protein
MMLYLLPHLSISLPLLLLPHLLLLHHLHYHHRLWKIPLFLLATSLLHNPEAFLDHHPNELLQYRVVLFHRYQRTYKQAHHHQKMHKQV